MLSQPAMRNTMITVSLALAAAACSSDDPIGTVSDSILAVQNRSDFVITDIRLAMLGEDYTRNLLGTDVLLPGEEIILGVDCGIYDARVVDDTGAVCQLEDVDLCLNEAVWVLTNASCPVFGAANATTASL